MAKTVLVPIADGTEEIEAVSIIDTLRRSGARVTVASVNELEITASRGVKLVADARIGECVGQTYDAIVLPGGTAGAENLRDCPELIEMLKAQQQAGRVYAAICAAPVVVLQHHGLLAGKKATCHPSLAEQLENKEAAEHRVVVDGTCVTSRGPGTAIEFALKLIEVLFDADRAQKVAEPMLVKA
ncbi:DJ-1 family protein [candidate division KSB3 bacterium]|uniref:DJ-1 family protein n=1 Tax=candidate division KSB3 bacterium TaxID=2044937 RepID=A0A9D5JUM7_9BACT|nr:DJ-1 family protein [candidate division KSB3 bacterium]MBD3324578.1 DJ-1 family protein [candidate division KSB3 bacterium]